jgi:hypothetical protein
LTERKYYQQPIKDEWVSRNDQGFYPPNGVMAGSNNTMFDDGGMTDMNQVDYNRKQGLN